MRKGAAEILQKLCRRERRLRNSKGAVRERVRCLFGDILRISAQEIFAWMQRTTRRELGFDRKVALQGGAVTAIHRADSAAKLNSHLHSAVIDGLYMQTKPDGLLPFRVVVNLGHELPR